MNEHFRPYRRKIKFYPSNDISIIPLINDLEFIRDKTSWGFPFRFGFFEIGKNDFTLISRQMLNHEYDR